MVPPGPPCGKPCLGIRLWGNMCENLSGYHFGEFFKMTPPFSGRISETPKNWVLGHDALEKKEKKKTKIQKKPHEAHEVRKKYAKDQVQEYHP